MSFGATVPFEASSVAGSDRIVDQNNHTLRQRTRYDNLLDVGSLLDEWALFVVNDSQTLPIVETKRDVEAKFVVVIIGYEFSECDFGEHWLVGMINLERKHVLVLFILWLQENFQFFSVTD